MLIEFLIGSIIIGTIRGGKAVRLLHKSFNKISVLILALLIHISFFHFAFRGYSIVLDNTSTLYFLSYGFLILSIIINYRFRESWVIFIGSIMNITCFFANGSGTVVSVNGLKYIGLSDTANLIAEKGIALFKPLTELTQFNFLARFIAIPKPYPYPQLFSIGDLLISIGIFLLIQRIMFDDSIDKNRMLSFNYNNRI